MITTITNGLITFTSDSVNAEPLMLRFNDEEINYLYRPINGSSAGTSVCFPVLGVLPNNQYHLNGEWFRMDAHGFASDGSDYCTYAKPDSVIYERLDSPQTREQYPFAFKLRISYHVRENELITEYCVYNPGAVVLPFSIGGHPRLACPIDPNDGTEFEDYSICFRIPQQVKSIVKSYGPVKTIEESFSADGKKLVLNDRLFKYGCFCFSPFLSERVLLRSEKSPRAVEMMVPRVTHFQLWKKVGEHFIALEPWYGSITSIPPKLEDNDWMARSGTICLLPGEEFSCSYGIRILR